MTRSLDQSFVFPIPVGPPGPAGAAGASGAGAANVEDWRGYGGDSSDTGTLLNAIAAAKVAGGMQLHVPAQTYSVDQTLLINGSHIQLTGEGAGAYRPTVADMQASPRSKFLWMGAAGGTIVHFTAPSGSKGCIGGGLRGIQLDGNDFLAARGLHVQSWMRGVFSDVVSIACSESCFRTSVINYALAASTNGNVQQNTFENCAASTVGSSGAYLTSTSIGWHLTGGSAFSGSFNTCFNTFLHCQAYMAKGIPWKLENTDTNFFYHITGATAYDSAVYGIDLGSTDQDTARPGFGYSRYNNFYAVQASIIARSSQTGHTPSFNNAFYGNTRGNAMPLPAMEAPAGGGDASTVVYYDNYGSNLARYRGFLENQVEPASIPGVTRMYIDSAAGQLKIKDSAGIIRSVMDQSFRGANVGAWTPTFVFTTPGNSVITHTIQIGKYQRMGNFILVMMEIEFNTNAYTTAGGSAVITGLPYSADAPGGTLSIGAMSKVVFSDGTRITLQIGTGNTRIDPKLNTSAGVTGTAGAANFPPSVVGFRIVATGMYWRD